MPQKALSMRKIREVLRLRYDLGLLQHEIARGMPMPVVDRLEMIQVAQDDAQLLLGLSGVLQRTLGLADEMKPVADPGQTV